MINKVELKLKRKNQLGVCAPKKLSSLNPIKVEEHAFRPTTCKSVGQVAMQVKSTAINVLDQSTSTLKPLIANNGHQSCCPYNCFQPFEIKDKAFNIPAALFLNLICQSVNMPDEHAIVVLALIDRFCNKVADLSYESNRFYKRFTGKNREDDAQQDL